MAQSEKRMGGASYCTHLKAKAHYSTEIYNLLSMKGTDPIQMTWAIAVKLQTKPNGS